MSLEGVKKLLMFDDSGYHYRPIVEAAKPKAWEIEHYDGEGEAYAIEDLQEMSPGQLPIIVAALHDNYLLDRRRHPGSGLLRVSTELEVPTVIIVRTNMDVFQDFAPALVIERAGGQVEASLRDWFERNRNFAI